MPAVLTLEKSLNLLEAILRAEAGVGTRALAQQLRINVATAHNIAMTFVARGYLRQDETTRLFYPGMRLMHLGNHPTYHQFLSTAASGVVQRLADELNETVQLVVNDQGRFLNLAYVAGRQALAVNDLNEIKLRNAHATAYGKMLLAHAAPAVLESYLTHHGLTAHTPQTITDPAAFAVELAKIRAQGYSRTTDEFSEGVSAIAVPAHDAWGNVFAALGASAPTMRMSKPGYADTLLAALRRAIIEIEKLWAHGSQLPASDAPPGNRRGRPRKKIEAQN
ncbi:IclR family transcriptional regulator [Geminisphaera colitermitum]|uniref:IclR family transcriptional regulator n=1 Tax=Geminisphaera colitermitum TaxID=1148786 RepID=UPI0001964F01|nr:IclR family transcriptional regulator [Geminisphaera colitermitum]